MNSFAILTDTTLCTGCEACVAACKQTYGLGKDQPRRWKRSIDDLSSTRHTTILRLPGGLNVRQQCRHCQQPACASACIVGALRKTPEGPVVYDPKRCMGCRYCMVACPFGIPRYDWESAAPTIRKCSMCYERLTGGAAMPACIESCPQKATIFGSLDEMRKVAHDRLGANPRYVQKVYGEKEIGGTSVLYISDRPLDFLGWKADMGDTPLPALTWAAMSKVPGTAVGVGALATAVYWIIGRRMRMQALALAEAPGVESKGSEDGASSSKQ